MYRNIAEESTEMSKSKAIIDRFQKTASSDERLLNKKWLSDENWVEHIIFFQLESNVTIKV